MGDGTANWHAVREELLAVESTPWQDIEDISIIDLHATKLVAGSMYIPQDKTMHAAHEARITFAFNKKFTKEHRELLPLCSELSELLSKNVRADLYSQFGFYSTGTTCHNKGRGFELIHTFDVLQLNPTKLSQVHKVVEDSIFDLHKLKGFQRLMAQLRHPRHNNRDKIFPSVNYIFKQTNLIIGKKGWQRIATKSNCDIVLSHMELSINIGDDTASLGVASLLGFK